MSAVVIHEFRATGRMSDAEYESERQRLRDTYGETKKAAGVRWEQELALLFYRSGWTQEKLAEKEGKSQRWISYQLQFGRFLNFSTPVLNQEKPAFLLTEGRFRGFWEKTEGDERDRFRAVARLIEEAKVQLRAPPRPQIWPDIFKEFADGKWHRPEVIAKELGTDAEHVKTTIDNPSNRHKNKSATIETRRVGKDANYGPGIQYRIFRKDREVSLNELTTKLTPIIEDLETQSHKAPGTVSNGEVGALAAKIRLILEQWAE